MTGWHHQLNGHEFEQIPGDSEGQESLACCSLCGHKELDTTEQPQSTTKIKPVNPKGIFIGRTEAKAKAEAPLLWPPEAKSCFIGKDPDVGKD